jgi:pimeloyl-ACP methyl ester carboxylesterase
MPLFRGSASQIHYQQTGTGPDIVWVGGGGTQGKDWQRFQTPDFDDRYQSTVFDNRGIGLTTCDAPMPWPIEAFSEDLAELVRGVCAGPVRLIGTSLGSAIVQQLAIDHPDLVTCAVVMGTGAWSTGWGWDYQIAEIEFRQKGGRLDGLMGATHYASMLYPARALGDRVLWLKLRALLLEWMESGENEESLAGAGGRTASAQGHGTRLMVRARAHRTQRLSRKDSGALSLTAAVPYWSAAWTSSVLIMRASVKPAVRASDGAVAASSASEMGPRRTR